jgi:hypothetical protein
MSFVDGYAFWKFASDAENLICRSCSFKDGSLLKVVRWRVGEGRGGISHDRLMNVLWKVNLALAINSSLLNSF